MSGSRPPDRSGASGQLAERVQRSLMRICLIGVASLQVAQWQGADGSFCRPGGTAAVVKTLLGCGGTGLAGIGQLADIAIGEDRSDGRGDSRDPGQDGGAEAWSAGRHPSRAVDAAQIHDLGGVGY